ncbi:MAG: hypothetical protein ACI93S_000838 [Ancylomarina sp.]
MPLITSKICKLNRQVLTLCQFVGKLSIGKQFVIDKPVILAVRKTIQQFISADKNMRLKVQSNLAFY